MKLSAPKPTFLYQWLRFIRYKKESHDPVACSLENLPLHLLVMVKGKTYEPQKNIFSFKHCFAKKNLLNRSFKIQNG